MVGSWLESNDRESILSVALEALTYNIENVEAMKLVIQYVLFQKPNLTEDEISDIVHLMIIDKAVNNLVNDGVLEIDYSGDENRYYLSKDFMEDE
jgi:DNA integrity scanning protein DisA with diadenylate cyclase activity